jgi:hypothetical protein
VSDPEEWLIRTVGGITAEDDGVRVWVDHVYTMENGKDGRPEPGHVGLSVHQDHDGVGVLLTPDDALVIANRLQRAANLVMESGEDLPDVEREYRRHTASSRIDNEDQDEDEDHGDQDDQDET